MKIVAVNSDTGQVLLSQSGTLQEDLFKQTVIKSFPQIDPKKIVIIVDGRIQEHNQSRTNYKAPQGKSVTWKGSFVDCGGYSNMNREICLRLHHHGFQVKIDMLKTGLQVGSMTHNMLKAMENVKEDPRSPLVIGFTPIPVRAVGRKVIFYTMMETQGLHPEFAKTCNISANEIWVPCKYYEKVFRECGVVKPIHVLPLGVNDKIYKPGAPEPDLLYESMPTAERISQLPSGFRFMSVFGWSYRKGTDVLCRSFLKEFDGNDDAYLVIYSRYMGSSAEQQKEYVREEIRGYYKECEKKNPARIFYCGDTIPINDLPGCYASADAFVFCSRGEGFGLPVIEAAACGIPVVSSYNTAMTEYLDEDVAYCVEPEGAAPANDKLCWISEYYRDQNFAVMGEDSILKFGKYMRSVIDSPKEAQDKSQKLRNRVLDNYTWDLCVERVAARLAL